MPAAEHRPVLVVGAGPGLGLSIARRFGREGHPVALLSRSSERHNRYLSTLREDGIEAIAVAADVRDTAAMEQALDTVRARFGPLGGLYYGPGAADPQARPAPLLEIRSADLRAAMSYHVEPALDLTGLVLPDLIDSGHGAILFATGLSAVVPLPGLGVFALVAAALRTYALTLNVALADQGVYAGALVLGGLIRGGDIHRLVIGDGGSDPGYPILDPDEIADSAWILTRDRDRAEATFSARTGPVPAAASGLG